MNRVTNKEKTSAFIVVFIIKVILLLIFVHFLSGNDSKKIYSYGGDTLSYINPMRNYIEKGSYYVEKNGIHYYAVRPPHYALLYYTLNKIGFNDNALFNLIIFFQILISCLSIILLSLLVADLAKRKYIFYVSVMLLSLTSSMSYFNQFLLPESIVISFLMISLYLVHKYYNSKKIVYIFFASLLMAYCVQLRPYILLALLIPYLYIFLLFLKSREYKFLFSHAILSGMAMAIIFVPWTYRNYKIYNTIAPYDYKLLDYYYGENYEKSIRLAKVKLLRIFGESDTFWDIKSMSSFFENDTSEFKQQSLFKFEDNYFSQSVTLKEFNNARNFYLACSDSTLDEKDVTAIKYFKYLTIKYQDERPFNYYVFSKVWLIEKMILHNGTYFLPFTFNQVSSYTLLLKIWKIFEFLLYKLLLLFTFVGIIFSFVKRKKEMIFVLIPISIIITVIILGGAEYRFFTLSYPTLYIFSFVGVAEIINAFEKKIVN